MTKKVSILKLLVAAILFVTSTNYSQLLPREYLQRQTKPVFRPGNTLPPLMTNGFGDATYGQPGEPILSFNNVKELAENWGYAFQIPSSATQSTNIIQAKSIVDNPASDANKIITLVNSNPAKYKMYGMIDLNNKFGRIPLSPIECPDCFARDANNDFIDQNGNIIAASTVTTQFLTTNHAPFVMNPFISDANLLRCSQKLGTMFDYIKQKAPITIAMDYGEAGVYIPYYAQRTWKKIPQAPTDLTSEIAGWNWLSEKWNRIMKGLWQDIPRNLTSDGFVYYYTNDAGLSNGRFGNGFGVSVDSWKGYNYNYDITKDQNKYTMGQTYFGQFNTGWGLAAINSQGIRDAFTTHMNTRALEIPLGRPYSIHWLASGWGDNIVSENDRWTGALKCFYTTGVLGANVGLYAENNATLQTLARLYPTTFNESQLPDYIKQWMSHSRVHAIYSWIEPFTMNSDLMEGQKIRDWGREERYYYAGGFDRAKPCYEFWAYPIGTAVPTPVANPVDNFINNAAVADQGARVVARKLRNSNKYLLTAWAMNGEDREVEVVLTGVGRIKVNARKAGTIYHIDNTSGTPAYTILDNDAIGIVTDEPIMKKTLCYLYNGGCQIQLGISDYESEMNKFIQISPNPNNGSFNVSFDGLEKDNYTLEVNNLLGQSVYKENFTNFSGSMNKQLSLPNNEKGVYIITLKNSNNNKISKKIVVN
jgi:hypothetical protein